MNHHLFRKLFLKTFVFVILQCFIYRISNDYVLLGSWGFKAQFFYSTYLDYRVPTGRIYMFFVYSLDRRLPFRLGKSRVRLSSGLPNSLNRGISGTYSPTAVFFDVFVEGVGNGSSSLATLGIELDRLGPSLPLIHLAMMILSSISMQLSCFLLPPRNLLMMAGFASSGLNISPNSEKSLPYKTRSDFGSSSLIILASSFTLLKTGRSLCLYPSQIGSSCSTNFSTLPESWKTILPELASSTTITCFFSYLRLSSYALIFSSCIEMTLDFSLSFSSYNSCICLRNSATWYSLRALSRQAVVNWVCSCSWCCMRSLKVAKLVFRIELRQGKSRLQKRLLVKP